MSDKVFSINISVDRQNRCFVCDFADEQLNYKDQILFTYSSEDVKDPMLMDGYIDFLVDEACQTLLEFKRDFRKVKEML